jgi:ribosome-binding factor A
MSNRLTRVAELLQREISVMLRAHWPQEAARITITEVSISPDLAQARVRYAVIGGKENELVANRLLTRIRGELRTGVGKVVTLKRTPDFKFVLDESAERSLRIRAMLDDLDQKDKDKEESTEG